MDTQQDILSLLRGVEKGELSPEDALLKLKFSPFEDLGYAKVDHHRGMRQGVPEVIYGQSKTPEQIAGILAALEKRGCTNILVTRINQETADFLSQQTPLKYEPLAKLAVVFPAETKAHGSIVIATGGTSDIGVAEEAALTAEALGNRVTRLYDVGVAGIHRLLGNLEPLMTARVVIAVAGMEGALASVVGGLVDCPVIAVPTSVGYGASFGGVAALLAMLNSCASGVSVVNIDNGFGAGFLASKINHMGDCAKDENSVS
jgi:pyridinium-3,5-biscarboxylic acid mononucleotide synthase